MKTLLTPKPGFLTKTNLFSSTLALDSAVKVTKAAVGGSTVLINFTVKCPTISDWEFVFISGSHSKLGNWNVEKAIGMIKDSKK